jgi:hypothetical protein
MAFMNVVIIPSVQFHAHRTSDTYLIALFEILCTHILLQASLLCPVCEEGSTKNVVFVLCHVKLSEFLCVSYISYYIDDF